MGRFLAEISTTCLTLDMAIAPAPRPGADPAPAADFGVALRQAARPEPKEPPASPSGNQGSSPPVPPAGAGQGESHRTDRSHPPEDDEVAGNRTPAPPGDDRGNDSPASDDGPVSAPPEENTGTDDAAEVAANAAAVIVNQVPLPAVDETLPGQAGGETLETAPPETDTTVRVSESEPKPGIAATGAAPPLEQPAPDQAVDEAAAVPAADAAPRVETVEPRLDPEPETPRPTTADPNTAAEGKNGEHSLAAAGATRRAGDTPSDAVAVSGTAGQAAPQPDEDPSAGHAGKRRATGRDPRHRGLKSPQAVGEEASPMALQKFDQAAGAPIALPENRPVETPAAAPPVEPPPASPPGVTEQAGQGAAATQTTAVAEFRARPVQTETAAGRSSGQEAARDVDPAKFVQRVVNAFSAVGQRGGSIRLKLYPPELGSLRMEITVKNGTLSAKVEAETELARSALVENLPILRDRLADQGIRITRFDVGVSDQSQGGPFQHPDGGQPFRHGARDADPRSGRTGAETDAVEGRDLSRPGVDGRLDVFI
ncbi:MAG: flagellar hook-length control protein FliK [Thermoguttaceae bacterium]